MGQRLTAPGRGYPEKGLRGSERTGGMVEARATPSTETDGRKAKKDTETERRDWTRRRRRESPPAWDPSTGG